MIRSLLVLVCGLHACLGAGADEDFQLEPPVKMLKASELEKTLNSYEYVLIMFFIPTCGACTQTKPGFLAAAKEVHKKNQKKLFAAVNCDASHDEEYCNKEKIEAFPTLRLYRGPLKLDDIEGGPDRQRLVDMMENPPSTPVEKKKQSDDQAAESNEKLIFEHAKLLGSANISSALKQSEYVLIIFFAPWCSKCQEAKPIYDKAASRLNKDKTPPNVIMAAFDCDEQTNQEYCEKELIEDYPSIRLYKNGVVWAELPTPLTESNIQEFITSPPKDKIPIVQKPPQDQEEDEEKKEETPAERMKHALYLDDSNFDMKLKATRVAVVMFYAPWCPHCQDLKPVYDGAAESINADSQTIMAAVNCEAPSSKKICSTLNIEGYPTLLHYENGKKVGEYPSGNTKDDFLKFFKEKATKKQEL